MRLLESYSQLERLSSWNHILLELEGHGNDDGGLGFKCQGAL